MARFHAATYEIKPFFRAGENGKIQSPSLVLVLARGEIELWTGFNSLKKMASSESLLLSTST